MGGRSMLSPYRVLDLTDDRGALAGMILAGLGAEVINVEPPEGSRARRLGPFVGDEPGPERSLWHQAYNRGKRSVTVDAVDLAALAADADVVIDSGALPVDLEALRAANPTLVTVSITPFGRGGPKDDWLATDLTILAAGCPLVLEGDADRAPVRMAVPQAYLHAGSDAACGALLALAERATSGLGQHVDISAQLSVAMATQSFILAESFHATKIERYGGGVRLGAVRLPLVFPALDGHVAVTFVFGTAIGPFTARFVQWMYAEGACDEAMRDTDWIGYGAELLGGNVTIDEWEQVLATVARFTASKTKDELFKGALERHCLVAPVATAADVLANEQFQSRGYWEPLEIGGRTVRAPGRLAALTGTPLAPFGPAPRLGEHNGTIAPRTGATVAAPAPAPGERRLPLEGLKVLDLMWVMAGPAATRVLADFGADVIRVESAKRIETARTLQPFWNDEVSTEGSALYQNMNAGKRNISLDLSMPEAREVVHDLIRWADVVTESFTPDVMAAWGLDYESVKAINPGVVMISSCLMGQTGPLRAFAGYGNLAAALCGFTEVVGWPDRPPAGPFSAYSDYVAPRMALAALLAALDHRRRTGEGQYIDFSQAEGALHFLAPILLDHEVNDRLPERVGNDDLHVAPHGVYPARGEDRWVAIVCETDEQWARLAGAIGHPELAGTPVEERLARRRELDPLIAGWTADRDEGDVQTELQGRGVPAHAVQNSAECRADPQFQALGHFVTTPHAEFGPVELEGPRQFLSATPGSVGPAPTLGQHLMEVLEDVLGYPEERITELLISGALE
jgi:crotonobetainyl-CoA:carnitine CoA-transferase CaiB-like acyl-CoA transferase